MLQNLLLLCLFLGFSTAEITLKSLQDQFEILKQQQKAAIANFSAHGLDLIVEELEDVSIRFEKSFLDAKPEVFNLLNKNFNDVRLFLANPMIYAPMRDQLEKAQGLYYAAMKEVDGETGSSVEIKNRVKNIIKAEVEYNSHCPRDVETINMIRGMVGNLNQLVHLDAKTKLLTMWDFFRLENDANESIAWLLSLGQTPEAGRRQSMLNSFLAVNYQMGKAFPLDSVTRMRQYYEQAPEHYRQYKSLRAILDQK